MKVFYSPSYVNGTFDTTAKAAFVNESLAADPIPGVEVVAPHRIVPLEHLMSGVHSDRYIEAVTTGENRWLAESSGLEWSQGHLRSVRTSTNGARAALAEAVDEGAHSGSLSSGMHHARRNWGAGFCTVNAVAMMALSCRVNPLILDFDAHCGGGTWDILQHTPGVSCIDVAVDGFDYYIPDREDWTLDIVRNADQYIETIEDRLDRVWTGAVRPEVIIYNAGMDPHERCDTGGLKGITTEILAAREEMVFKLAFLLSVPVAFVLAGGYIGDSMDMDELASLHRLTIKEANTWQI